LRHIAYVLATASIRSGYAVTIAYTTTSGPSFGRAKPLGTFIFDRDEAACFGQPNAFRLDLKRIAIVPLTDAWFPSLADPDHGKRGRLPEHLQARIEKELKQLLLKHREQMSFGGPGL
jgi:hypothetical protein